MEDFAHEHWLPILAHNGLAGFAALWDIDIPWFEPPNQRRGGWSGVSRLELKLPAGGTCTVFLKRQENHKTFSWRHPIVGIPTFLREFELIRHYRTCGIATLEPVFFGMRTSATGHRAILATAELAGFNSLATHARIWQQQGIPSVSARRRILNAVASLARSIHAARIQHNCFYPKHVFIRQAPDGAVEARVIDLEKSRRRPFAFLCAQRDLDTLNRHAPEWSRSERLRFLKAYLRSERLTPYGKWLWRQLARQSR